MLKSLTNLQINSILLESDESSTQEFSTAVTLNITAQSATSKRKYPNLRMRIIAANAKSVKPMDFITQRYNEYFSKGIDNLVGSSQYNDSVYDSLRTNKLYLQSGETFSPFSINPGMSEILFRNGTFARSGADPIPPNLIIGDFLVQEMIDTQRKNQVIFKEVNFGFSPTDKNIKSLSFYVFIYQQPDITSQQDKGRQSFAINNLMTMIARANPIGLQYNFAEASVENPYLGMSKFTTIASPDKNRITIRTQDTNATSIPNIISLLEKLRSSDLSPHKSLQNKNYFSDLWLSRDDKDNHRIALAFDIRSFLINNSVFPSLYRSDKISKILLGDYSNGFIIAPAEPSQIKMMTLLRKQVDSSAFAPGNILATEGHSLTLGPSNTFPEVEIETMGEVTDMGAALGETRFLEATDTYTARERPGSQDNGTFRYGVRFSVSDSSLEVMRNLTSFFLRLEHSTVLIINSLTVSVTASAAKSLLSNLEGIDFLLSLMSSSATLGLKDHYASMIYPGDLRNQAPALEEIKNICSLVARDMMDRLKKIAPDNPLGESVTLGPKALAMGQNKMSNTLQQGSVHYFPEVFEIGEYSGYGVDYIMSKNTTSNGIESIKIEDYLTRREEEFIKYFQPIIGANTMPPETGYFADASYSYMTPKIIRTPLREVINQPSVKSKRYAVLYDYERYAQLFTDIVSLNLQKNIGFLRPTPAQKQNNQSKESFVYSSTLNLLSTSFGVKISDVIVPQFSSPKVSFGSPDSTVDKKQNAKECTPGDSDRLIPVIVGGASSVQVATTELIKLIDVNIMAQDKTQLPGYISLAESRRAKAIGAIKLPFAILGELSLDPNFDLSLSSDAEGYNSLTRLRNFLNIPADQLNEAFQDSLVSALPNQVKSMLAFAASDEREILGLSSGETQYSATRPKLQDSEKVEDPDQMISYYGKQEKIPPYPRTKDPMKTYSKFLAFWMNYKQIAVVEYLDGFEETISVPELSNESDPQQRLKLPKWKKLDASKGDELRAEPGKILCRVRAMSSEDYVSLAGDQYSLEDKAELAKIFETKQILNLPSYNEYFYLEGATLQEETSVGVMPETIASEAMASTPNPYSVGI